MLDRYLLGVTDSQTDDKLKEKHNKLYSYTEDRGSHCTVHEYENNGNHMPRPSQMADPNRTLSEMCYTALSTVALRFKIEQHKTKQNISEDITLNKI